MAAGLGVIRQVLREDGRGIGTALCLLPGPAGMAEATYARQPWQSN